MSYLYPSQNRSNVELTSSEQEFYATHMGSPVK